jgi:RNA polymerase primary sigma factor
LMKAVQRFDPRKGAKLSTYASWWIKQSIRRTLSNQSRTIRLPVHIGGKLLRLHRASTKLEEALGRQPTDEELAEELKITTAQVSKLRTAALTPGSLDTTIGDDANKTFKEISGDLKSKTPYAELEEKTTFAMVNEMLTSLPERERLILHARFGLDGEEEMTLKEVGLKFGVTHERIRQLQQLALEKLRGMIDRKEAVKIAA